MIFSPGGPWIVIWPRLKVSPVALVLAKGAPAGIRRDLGVAARGERKPCRATPGLDHSANGMARYYPLSVECESRPKG